MGKIYTAKDAGEISRLKERLDVYKEVVKEAETFFRDQGYNTKDAYDLATCDVCQWLEKIKGLK